MDTIDATILRAKNPKNQDAAKALMLATGAEPLKFGGVLYNPAGTRSGNVYYRPASTREVLDLDSK